MAQANSTAFHTHILESKVQAVAGQEFYGKTLVQYMHDLGLLNRSTTIAHGVWTTDADIALLGEAKCSVVHNTLSNMKLSSGVAPIRKLIDAGVNVALGTDGISTSDTSWARTISSGTMRRLGTGTVNVTIARPHTRCGTPLSVTTFAMNWPESGSIQNSCTKLPFLIIPSAMRISLSLIHI